MVCRLSACSCCNPCIIALNDARGTIAKIILWTGMASISVGFAVLYTFCGASGTSNDPNDENCPVAKSYLGLIFIFMLFANYVIYTLIKDSTICCLSPIACCDSSLIFSSQTDSNPVTNINTVSPEVGDDVRATDIGANMEFDLPSYTEALTMEKVEQPKSYLNQAFTEEPPEYFSAQDTSRVNIRINEESTSETQSAVLTPVTENENTFPEYSISTTTNSASVDHAV